MINCKHICHLLIDSCNLIITKKIPFRETWDDKDFRYTILRCRVRRRDQSVIIAEIFRVSVKRHPLESLEQSNKSNLFQNFYIRLNQCIDLRKM